MTDPIGTAQERELIEKLRMKEHRGRFMPGGGTIDAEGKGTMWGGEKIMEPRNPDGNHAADALQSRIAEVERLTARVAHFEYVMLELEKELVGLRAALSQHGKL